MFNSKKKRKRQVKKSIARRLFRSTISIIILTAFVLGISLFAKNISSLEFDSALGSASPLFAKLGLSTEAAEKAGQVAGDFASRILDTNISPSKNFESTVTATGSSVEDNSDDASTTRKPSFKVAVMSDSENNLDNLAKAMETASKLDVHTVFFLGDYTSFGMLEELKGAKEVMDKSGVPYYSLPGDRDLYDTVGRDNFDIVFGAPKESVTIGEKTFVMLDNSANSTTISEDIMRTYMTAIDKADFVLISQPLYHPQASYGKPVMGLYQGETVKELKDQADILLTTLRKSKVQSVISGDHHSFSNNPDPVKQEMTHVTLPSVTEERADRSKSGILLISVYEDGSYELDPVNL